MKTTNKMPELLSPAGSPEALMAAVLNGCDAVYMGGRRYGARNAAENFSDTELKEAIDFCHLKGVKAYITLNTLYKNEEIKPLLQFAARAYEFGADAFITQDMGVSEQILRHMPDIPLHASTQATACGSADAEFLRDMGFKRVVLAREAPLSEITSVCTAGIECEVFVHGALCVSFSGQCLFSSFLGGRSGNRGRCAQPCRLRYELNPSGASGYLLSTKDIMTLDILDKIVSAGVSALKIEGRMRSPEYVGLATRLYREALCRISAGYGGADAGDIKKLATVFSRGGCFSEGYFFSRPSRGMMSTDTPKATGIPAGVVSGYEPLSGNMQIRCTEPLNPGDGIEIYPAGPGWSSGTARRTARPSNLGCGINKKAGAGDVITVTIKGKIKKGDAVYKTLDKPLMDEIRKTYATDTRKLTLKARFTARINKPIALELRIDEPSLTAEAQGAAAQQAVTAPISTEEAIKRLEKTGGDHFNISVTDIEIDDNVYINIKDINDLRRRGLSAFEEKYLQSFRRSEPPAALEPSITSPAKTKTLTVSVFTEEQFYGALEAGASIIYMEACNSNIPRIIIMCGEATRHGVSLYAALPRINSPGLCELLSALERAPIHGYLARTWGQLQLLKDTNKEIRADFTFNVLNSLTQGFINRHAACVTLSPELSLKQLNRLDGENAEVIVYGRMPLMITKQCPIGNYASCENKCKTNPYYLKDRLGKSFPLLTDCENCLCVVLNADTTDMLDRPHDLSTLPQAYLRLMFTTESREETHDIITMYQKALNSERPAEAAENRQAKTHGHFYRGVL